MPSDAPPSSSRHYGNFGAIRLLLSLAVIVGHTPELHDGNRHREPLTAVFGTLSLGNTAVIGFFLLSGYLLTASIRNDPNLLSYFSKRAARIFPGFLVACLFCLVVVAPLAGGRIEPDFPLRMLLLLPPNTDGAFAGLRYPSLNGALWTIHHEAGCYLVLAGLSALGLLGRRWIILALTVLVFAVTFLFPTVGPDGAIRFGDTPHFPHLLSAFLAGVSARLFLDPARLRGPALLAGCLLLPALCWRVTAEPAMILLGGVVLFWVCEWRATPVLSRIGRRTDLSYGIYLYAWPVQNLLIWRFGIDDLWAIGAITVLTAASAAMVSWHVVERPAMRTAAALIDGRFGWLQPRKILR